MTNLTISSENVSHGASKINDHPRPYINRFGVVRYFLILGVILLALYNSLVAATYYVAKTGNDNHAGTSAAPWLTVQKAANVVAAGDTVNVAAGTYAEKATISRGGSSSSRISFIANGSVTIGGFYVTSPYVSLTGFSCNGTNVDINDAAIMFYYNAHFGEVRNCATVGFTGITQGAGGLYFYSNNCLADSIIMTNPNFHAVCLGGNNNLFKNFAITMPTGWDAIRIVGSNITVQDGTISASNPGDLNTNHCDIFQTFGDDPVTVSKDVVIERVYVSNGQGYQLGNITDDQENGNISRWTFRNNTFIDIERTINHFAPDCSYLNNTFIRCGVGSGWAILIGSSGAGHSDNLTIKNNIFYQCGYSTSASTGWYGGDPVTGIVADYNLVVGTGSGTTKDTTSWKNGVGISGSFEANGLNGIDPLFVNPSAGNYSLQSGSPALARGMGANAVPPIGAPAFTTQPSSQSVAVGANVTFTAAAGGTPSPTYQWRKGGVNISGATSATLTLTSVATSAAGTYSLVATNSAGSATSNGALLTVTSSVGGNPNPWVLGVGDSIMSGFGPYDPTTANPIAVMQAAYPAAKCINIAVMGTRISTNTSASDTLAQLATATSQGYSKCTVIIHYGGNDIGVNDSVATIEANLTTWITNVRAAYPGVKIVGTTIFVGNFGANASIFNPRRLALNAWINSWTVANGHTNGYDAVCDCAADSRFGDFTNRIYFDSDQVHLTVVGYSILSELMQTTLSASGLLTPIPLAPSNAKTSITIN